jgi:hypothetical protein
VNATIDLNIRTFAGIKFHEISFPDKGVLTQIGGVVYPKKVRRNP